MRTQKGIKLGCLLGILLALAAVFFSLYMIFAIVDDRTVLQNEIHSGYLPFGKIATICVIPTNVEHKAWMYFYQYDPNGKATKPLQQNISGDQVQLQGVSINYQPYMQIVGLQSIYKLTLLQGHYLNAGAVNASSLHPTSIPLNGGEDAQFKQLHSNPSAGVTASHDALFTVPANGTTYDVFATSNGLFSRLAPQQIKACGATS